MQIKRNDSSTSFGLTPRYSKDGKIAKDVLAVGNQKIVKVIDAGKDEFAKFMAQKGIHGDFCITDMYAKTKDDFVVKFFIQENGKTAFPDQFTVNSRRDIIKIREEVSGNQKQKQKSIYNMQEKITNYFKSSYDKHARVGRGTITVEDVFPEKYFLEFDPNN